MIRIFSIQVGKVVTEGDATSRDPTLRQWTSAFRKLPISGAALIDPMGIKGDEVADTKHHGGRDKAILCYSNDHYGHWAAEHPELVFLAGGFGENLTVDGGDESSVCLGDRYRCGSCEFEISQPRQPCWKISRRWQVKTMTKEVAQTGRTGWYLRVIQAGTIAAGMEMQLAARPNPDWTVRRANDVLFGRLVDRTASWELMNLAELSDEWKAAIA